MSENLDHIRSANQEFAGRFPGEASTRPVRRLVVVTCMDARIDVLAALGLQPGDAHILRNAGGIVTGDTVRSICLSQRLLGTRAIAVVQHTDCGLEGVASDEFVDSLVSETGQRPSWEVGGFERVEDSVRRSIAHLQQDPFLAHRGEIVGFVYETATGRLREVGPAA